MLIRHLYETSGFPSCLEAVHEFLAVLAEGNSVEKSQWTVSFMCISRLDKQFCPQDIVVSRCRKSSDSAILLE